MSDLKGKEEFGPWNPGLESIIPSRLLPLSTMFRAENVETDYTAAHELADFCGMRAREVVAFRPERLIIHELLVRVTADLSVPDGPDYEELGINMRSMVARIYDHYVSPKLTEIKREHSALIERAGEFITTELKLVGDRPTSNSVPASSNTGLLQRIFGKENSAAKLDSTSQSEKRPLDVVQHRWREFDDPFQRACGQALLTTTTAVLRTRGRLPTDHSILVDIAVSTFNNNYGSISLGVALDPIIEEAAIAENYRFLPAQSQPVVMNVKGASASGKSTIRPYQRELAKRLGIPWEDFALISPDYWRKYLFDYESLGADFKYGAMLTGHELSIIDAKLDRYMAQKADRGSMPHLLIDRFRFDSFTTGDHEELGSNLLTRFGHTVFMFFMITSPKETIERAWMRGKTTGRYKAVDDLLDHNVEAYSGMPPLFFSWALSSKKVHYEFLNNDVPLGSKPKTVAAGWNDEITIYDIGSIMAVDRFKNIDIDAQSESEMFPDKNFIAPQSTDFLNDCAKRLNEVNLADAKTGIVYGTINNGNWTYQDRRYVGNNMRDNATLAGLSALGWDDKEGPSETKLDQEKFVNPTGQTFGHLGFQSV